MNFYKYRVFNYSKRRFEFLTTSTIMAVGEFKVLPQGELQVFELVSVF